MVMYRYFKTRYFCKVYIVEKWFSNLSWRTPSPSHFVNLTHISHLIQLISSLVDCKTWGTFKLTLVPNVLPRFLGWMTCFLETVCNRVWDTFSLVWWECQKCDEYMNINRAVLKRQLAQRIQVKSFNVSAAARYTQQLKILEDMFVVRVL